MSCKHEHSISILTISEKCIQNQCQKRTQSWPFSTISLVLYQSPYFIALFKSVPWWPYRLVNIRSWSFRPPYCLLGAPSWTVAKERAWDEGRRAAAEAEGRERLESWAREALVGAAARVIIVTEAQWREIDGREAKGRMRMFAVVEQQFLRSLNTRIWSSPDWLGMVTWYPALLPPIYQLQGSSLVSYKLF